MHALVVSLCVVAMMVEVRRSSTVFRSFNREGADHRQSLRRSNTVRLKAIGGLFVGGATPLGVRRLMAGFFNPIGNFSS